MRALRRGLVAHPALQRTLPLAAKFVHTARRGLASIPTMEHKTANDVASRPVKTCAPTANITEALATLAGGKFGALICQEGSDGFSRPQLHGVITERDFLTKVPMEGSRFSMFEPSVADLMTPAESMTCAEPGWSLQHCLDIMLEGGFRHLPILEQRGVEAMLSLYVYPRPSPLTPLTSIAQGFSTHTARLCAPCRPPYPPGATSPAPPLRTAP